MTEKVRANQDNQEFFCDAACCMRMMEEISGEQDCDCTEMMFRMMDRARDDGFAELMSRMVAMCHGVQSETEETTVGPGLNSDD